MAIKVAVFNQKGGVGKTTLAIILTQIALINNQKLLAIDQDEQNNFNVSISYLQRQSNFKDLFTFKTSLTKEDFKSTADWIIIDCPPAFNDRSKFALQHSDFVLIPVRPDVYSTMTVSKIMQTSGDSKKFFQFPIVKVGFTSNVASREASTKIESLRDIGYRVIGDLPLYATIPANISSNRKKWWSVGLQASARRPFELVYTRLELLYKELQEIREKEGIKPSVDYDYYDDPENFHNQVPLNKNK